MSDGGESRLRLTVLGGYLGAGKTTWLRHQLHAGRYADACVIVNEAAEIPVDDALLGEARELVVLAGGCACCTGRNELLAALRQLCDTRSARASAGRRLERIVLETSGLADPGAVVAAIKADPVLVHHLVIHEIIVVVDALNALSQLRSEPGCRAQIEVADHLLVTKIDVAESAALGALLATLRAITPVASMVGAVHGVTTPLPAFEGAAPESLPQAGEQPAPPAITPTRLQLGPDIDWATFSVWLSALLHARGEAVVRVKGVVQTPAGRLLLQSVRKVVQSPEILPPQEGAREDNTIVVIGRGYTPEQLERSLQYFAGTVRQADRATLQARAVNQED